MNSHMETQWLFALAYLAGTVVLIAILVHISYVFDLRYHLDRTVRYTLELETANKLLLSRAFPTACKSECCKGKQVTRIIVNCAETCCQGSLRSPDVLEVIIEEDDLPEVEKDHPGAHLSPNGSGQIPQLGGSALRDPITSRPSTSADSRK